MRLPILCSFIASTSLVAACGPSGPKTSQEVGDKVLAALVAKDWAALKSLYVTPDVIKSACAAMPAEKLADIDKEFAEEAQEAEEKFKKCLAIDWTGAKITGVLGGEAKKPVEGCANLVQAGDIELEVEAGAKKYTVKVNDPALLDGHYALIEGIRCKAPEALVEAAPAGSGDVCEKYFAKFAQCIDAMPEAGRDQIKKGFEAAKAAMQNASPESKAATCGAAMTTAKQAQGQLCPAVSWD